MNTMNILISLLQLILIPACSPLCVGVIRKIKARMQGRIGASVFQPYRDLLKFFQKDEVISFDASWISRFAPYLIFAVTVVLGASIPAVTALTLSLGGTEGEWITLFPLGDFLVIVYLLMLSTFLLALMGMDAGGGFGGFGASREMTMAALAEGGLVFSLLVVSLLSGTGNVMSMVENLKDFSLTESMPLFIAFMAFFIALLSENGRFPVDNPATHLELTMIHEAMLLEHSGKRLALLEWAAANKLFIFLSLGVTVFFPWGVPTIIEALNFGALFFGVFLFVAKILILLLAIAFIESTMAKFRIFRVPDLLVTSFVLSIIALVITLAF